MKISIEQIRELREKTGVSIMKCREALELAEGDFEKAIIELRKKGESSAAKRVGRSTGEGVVASYIHSNGKVGVLLELRCETDFVARNEEFQALAKELAMHVAAMGPIYVAPDDISEDVIKKEEELEREALKDSEKTKEVIEKIIEGKLKKFKEENSLLTQPFIKDPDKTISELVKEKITKLGENIQVERFTRFEI